jgi:nitrate/TMAO reductase-like tetraheme cytochrome c subunit
MNKRIMLLGVAILAIGLVVLPQTIALFSGQHNWYDIITSPSNLPCMKCHEDVYQEITTGGGQVNTLHAAQSPDGGCDACHIIAPTTKEGLTQGGAPTNSFHAAADPACLDCHSGTGPGVDARSILVGPEEAHKPFVAQANTSGLLKGSNAACISCHTHIGVNITWSRATTIEFNATETVLPTGNHSWIVGAFSATGVNITKTCGTGNGTPC